MKGLNLVRLIALGLVASLALGICACSTEQPAARFGNEAIAEDEVTAYTERFRAENGLADDEAWASFVTSRYGSTKSWREEAIRTLADERLIRKRASELGITADDAAVQAKLAEAMEQAGFSADDEDGWADYLAQQGTTPERYRDKLKYSSIQEQVYERDLDFTDELRDEMCTEYIEQNFADQVMRRYWGIPFGADQKKQARECLNELSRLEGDELEERFLELYEEVTGESVEDKGYLLGWDFLYNESRIDPEGLLRNSGLQAGELYDGLLAGSDEVLRVVLCAERVSFVNTDYTALESESMKGVVANLAMSSIWASECNNYLRQLEQDANIQVLEMPEGLPYDVATDD